MADEPATPAPAEPAKGNEPAPDQPTLPNTDPAPQQPEPAPEPDPQQPQPQGDPADLGDAGKRALAEERRARREAERLVKELQPLADKARELDEAQKTELQRLQEAAEQHQRRAQEAELRVLRLEVASEKGLTAAQARRLVGATKDELAEDADDLLASFQPAPQQDAPAAPQPPASDETPAPSSNGDRTRRPVESLRPGAAPDAEPEEDEDAIASRIKKLRY